MERPLVEGTTAVIPEPCAVQKQNGLKVIKYIYTGWAKVSLQLFVWKRCAGYGYYNSLLIVFHVVTTVNILLLTLYTHKKHPVSKTGKTRGKMPSGGISG